MRYFLFLFDIFIYLYCFGKQIIKMCDKFRKTYLFSGLHSIKVILFLMIKNS